MVDMVNEVGVWMFIFIFSWVDLMNTFLWSLVTFVSIFWMIWWIPSNDHWRHFQLFITLDLWYIRSWNWVGLYTKKPVSMAVWQIRGSWKNTKHLIIDHNMQQLATNMPIFISKSDHWYCPPSPQPHAALIQWSPHITGW